MAITPEHLRVIVNGVEVQTRLKQILDINSHFIEKKVDSSPESFSRSDALMDGELISEVMFAQHGLNLDRFAKLNQVQRDYVCTLVAAILERLCDHLEKLTHFVRSDK